MSNATTPCTDPTRRSCYEVCEKPADRCDGGVKLSFYGRLVQTGCAS